MTALIRQWLKTALLLLVLGCLVFIIFRFFISGPDTPNTVINQTLVVQEISKLGRLELVKYQFKDVVEYQKEQTNYSTFNRFLPKAKAVLIVSGEAVGCVDLSKLKEADIVIQENLISLFLPEPEICYFKIDHSRTRVYDVSNGYFVDEGEMVGEAFKAAEAQIRQSALETGILEATKKNAQTMLMPFLSNISSKKVVISWKLNIQKK